MAPNPTTGNAGKVRRSDRATGTHGEQSIVCPASAGTDQSAVGGTVTVLRSHRPIGNHGPVGRIARIRPVPVATPNLARQSARLFARQDSIALFDTTGEHEKEEDDLQTEPPRRNLVLGIHAERFWILPVLEVRTLESPSECGRQSGGRS